MKTPSETRARREEAHAYYDLVPIPSHPIRFKLQKITLIGQGVKLATLQPAGSMIVRNEKGEKLSLKAATTPRLV